MATYLHRLAHAALFTALALSTAQLATSCGKAKTASEKDTRRESPDSAAVYYYRLAADGRFTEYVAAMHSCDNTTPEYRQRMETYLRDYHASLKEEKGGGVSAVSVTDKQLSQDGKYARVFLSVKYKDGSTEEVLFPMVFADGKWRIQ